MERSDAVAVPVPPNAERATVERDPHTGRFLPGNNAGAATQFKAGVPGPRLAHGLRSRLLVDPEVETVARTMEERTLALCREIGATSIVKISLADKFVKLEAVAEHMAANLLRDGAVTYKGRTRALVKGFLNVVDQMRLLARELGLEKQTQIEDLLRHVK